MNTPKKVRSARAIARELGISPATVSKFLHLPGAPRRGAGGYDLTAAVEFIRANASNTRTAARVNPVIASLKERELTLKCDRLAFALNKEKGLFVLKTDVGSLMRGMAHTQCVTLRAKLERELPPRLVGLDVFKIMEVMAQTVDEICRIFRTGTADCSAPKNEGTNETNHRATEGQNPQTQNAEPPAGNPPGENSTVAGLPS